MHIIGHFKIMVFPFILCCGGQGCPPQYKYMGSHDFKNVISHDLHVQLFLKFKGLL